MEENQTDKKWNMKWMLLMIRIGRGYWGLDMGSQPGSDPDGQQPSTVALQTIIN